MAGGSGGAAAETTAVGAEGTTPKAMVMPPPETPSAGLCKVTLLAKLSGHQERVWSIDWHPTEPVLASCSSDKTLKLWAPKKVTGSLAETQNDDWHCIGNFDGEHGRTIRQVSWSPDGNVLAAASFDATVSMWRKCTPDFDLVVDGVLDGHENEVKSVAWDTDGRCLATCSRDKTVWIWDRGTSAPIVTEEDDEEVLPDFECAAVLTGHSQDVKSVRWVPHSRVLMSCGYDDTIKVWEESKSRSDDWHCTRTLQTHASTVWQIAFQTIVGSTKVGTPSPAHMAHSVLMASASDDTTFRVWQRSATGASCDSGECEADDEAGWTHWNQLVVTSDCHDRTVYSVDWAPPFPAAVCSSLLATGSGDDSVGIHEVSSTAASSEPSGQATTVTTLHKEEAAHDADVNAVKWFPRALVCEGKVCFLLASAGDDGIVKIWKVETAAGADETPAPSAE